MKKILYIITQSDFGGAQRYVFDLATHLTNEFDVIVAAGKEQKSELFERLTNMRRSDLRGRSDLLKINLFYLKHLKRAINPWRDLLAFFELRKLIKQEKPDIIHLNSTKASVLGSLAPQFLVPSSKPLIIYTAHGWVFNEPLSWPRQKIYFYAEKWTARLKDKIICVSEYDRQIALESGFPAEKLTTIHNGIDFDNLKFLEKAQSRQKLLARIPSPPPFVKGGLGGIFIGNVANLYPTKGIEYLIETAYLLGVRPREISRGLTPRCVFFVIGEGPERPGLEKLIKKYNLQNNFFLLGYLPNASQYLKAFDIFVLPSVKEGFPYAILEAMAAGLPIIATKVGGVPEMITTGSDPVVQQKEILVKPKNSQELAEKILYFWKNPKVAKEIGEQAQKRVKEKFTLGQMVTETQNVYLNK